MSGEQPLLHAPENAAKRLDLGRTKVYELIASGELASIKIGRARRVPEAALVDYIQRKITQAA